MTRRARHKVAISLFPFIAVLVCIMGSFVVLLVMMVARVGSGKGNAAVDEALAATAGQQKELRDKADDAHWRRDMLEQQRSETAQQLAERRLAMSHLEDHTRRLQDQARMLLERARAIDAGRDDKTRDVAAAKAELAAIREQLTAKEKELAAARAKKPSEQWYALIPYNGPSGTRRRPIYIECCEQGVILQPEGMVFGAEDFSGPLDAGNPLDAALRATREYLAKDGPGKHGEPYPLLVVRPSGIVAYGAARTAMKTWDEEFGYELVSEDKKLAFGSPDRALMQVLGQTVAVARQRQAMLAAAMPGRFNEEEALVSFAPEDQPDYARTMAAVQRGNGGGGAAGGGNGPANGGRGSAGGGNSGGAGRGFGVGGNSATGSSIVGGGSPGAGTGMPGLGIATGNGAAGFPGGIAGGGSGGGNGGSAAGNNTAMARGVSGGSGGDGFGSGDGPGTGNGGTGRGGGSGGSGQGSGGQAGGGQSGGGGSGGIAGGGGTFVNGGSAGGGSGGSGSGVSGGSASSGGNSISGGNNAFASGGSQSGGGAPAYGPQGQAPGDKSYRGQSGRGQTASNGHSGGTSSNGSSSGGTSGGNSASGGQAGGSGGPASGQTVKGAARGGTGGPGSKPGMGGKGGGISASDFANQPHATAVTRPIRMQVLPDRVLVYSDDIDRPPKSLPLSSQLTSSEVDAVLTTAKKEVDSWGLAVENGYWKPILKVEVAPNAEPRFEELQTALQGSGFDIQRKLR